MCLSYHILRGLSTLFYKKIIFAHYQQKHEKVLFPWHFLMHPLKIKIGAKNQTIEQKNDGLGVLPQPIGFLFFHALDQRRNMLVN